MGSGGGGGHARQPERVSCEREEEKAWRVCRRAPDMLQRRVDRRPSSDAHTSAEEWREGEAFSFSCHPPAPTSTTALTMQLHRLPSLRWRSFTVQERRARFVWSATRGAARRPPCPPSPTPTVALCRRHPSSVLPTRHRPPPPLPALAVARTVPLSLAPYSFHSAAHAVHVQRMPAAGVRPAGFRSSSARCCRAPPVFERFQWHRPPATTVIAAAASAAAAVLSLPVHRVWP